MDICCIASIQKPHKSIYAVSLHLEYLLIIYAALFKDYSLVYIYLINFILLVFFLLCQKISKKNWSTAVYFDDQ